MKMDMSGKKQLLLPLLLAMLPLLALAQAKPLSGEVVSAPKVIEAPAPYKSRYDANKAPAQGVMAKLKYERLADMSKARTSHLVFPTGDGGFVVVGGTSAGYTDVTTAEVYSNGAWKTLALGSSHADAFSAILPDGRVMIGGGDGKQTELYSPASQKFTSGPDMTLAREGCKAIVVGNKVYVSGNSGGGADNVMDCYDGSTFKGVGDMDARYHPYLFYSSEGYIVSMSFLNSDVNMIDFYTFSDGSKGLLADRYNMSTGETKYVATPYDETLMPTLLPDDMRSSDYHFTAGGENLYMILAMMADDTQAEGFRNVLLYYDAEENKTYIFSKLSIPMTHPVTGESIEWRGGVIVNEAKYEAYLIGHSGDYADETLHILSFNYTTEEWTLASASGFNHDMTETAAWTLLADGRLACTGGAISSMNPSAEAYIFTPPVAGRGDENPDDPQVKGNTLVVTTKDGVKTTYLLSEKPQVRFEGKDLRVVSTKADVTYKISDILRFTYVRYSSTGIDEITDDPAGVDYRDGELVISGIKAGAAVGVYAADGKMVRQLTVQHAGTFRLSLSQLPQGVYVVKADNVSYKIMKR